MNTKDSSVRKVLVEFNCSECEDVNILELSNDELWYDFYCESETPEHNIRGACDSTPYECTYSRVFLLTDLTDDELINKYESKKVHS